MDGLIKIKDFDFNYTFLDKKSYENIMIYDISCKTPMDGFNRDYNGAKHCLALEDIMPFSIGLDRYLISLKSDLSYVSHKYRKMKMMIKIMIFP